MSSRPRKTFPPGTFIPTSQRLMAIGQLCIAFSLMLWYMTQPFMGEYFALRSRMLLYEYTMGTSDILKGQEDKLKRQAERFRLLPESKQHILKQDYKQLQTLAQRSTLQKIQDGILTLIRNIPPFEQAWIFFSITIAILILLKIEGAKTAAWLLPMIVFAYAADNQLTGKSRSFSPDLHLFPTEKEIIKQYIAEPLASSVIAQQKQLEKGWKRYLIENWSTHANDLEEAEFQFTLARVELLHSQTQSEWLNTFHEKSNRILLLFYFMWNILFAWSVSQRPRLKS